MKKFQDDFSKSLYGMSKSEAISKGICLKCKEEALPKCYSEAGMKDFYILGMCEKCYDELFQEE